MRSISILNSLMLRLIFPPCIYVHYILSWKWLIWLQWNMQHRMGWIVIPPHQQKIINTISPSPKKWLCVRVERKISKKKNLRIFHLGASLLPGWIYNKSYFDILDWNCVLTLQFINSFPRLLTMIFGGLKALVIELYWKLIPNIS